MSEVLEYTKVSSVTAATTLTGINPTHASGNYLLSICTIDVSGGTITVPPGDGGWAAMASEVNNARQTVRSAYIKCTGSSMADPVWAFTSSANTVITTILIENADGTNFLDTGISTLTNVHTTTTATLDTVSGTLTNGNVLCLQYMVGDSACDLQAAPGPMVEFIEDIGAGDYQHGLGWFYEESSGAVSQPQWWMTRQAQRAISLLIPIRLADGTTPPPRMDHDSPPSVCILPATHENNGFTKYPDHTHQDPTSRIGAIGSIDTNYVAPVGLVNLARNPFMYALRITASTAGEITVDEEYLDTHANLDLAGRNVSVNVKLTSNGLFARLGNLSDHGFVFGIGTLDGGTGSDISYRLWDVGAQNADVKGLEWRSVVINPNDTDNLATAEIGAGFDDQYLYSVILGVGNIVTDSVYANLTQVHVHNTITLLGGYAAKPVSWENVKKATDSSYAYTTEELGDAYECSQSIQVGNGSDPLYFATNGQVLYAPAADDFAARMIAFQGAPVSRTFYGVSGNTIKINDLIDFAGGTFEIHASSTSSATWDFEGGTLKAVETWTIGADVGVITGLTITGSAELDMSATSADFDLSGGCTITNGSDTYDVRVSGATAAAIQAQLDLLANCTIADLIIESSYAGNVAVSLDNMTVTNAHYKSSQASSVLTATMTNGSTIGATSVEDDETFTVSNDVTLTVNINVTGAESTLLENGTQTEIDHEETSTTTYSYTYTYSTDIAADLQVFKKGYKPYWNDDITLGNTSQSVSVTLEEEQASEF